ncbi:MAG: PAS domain S-box protein, partial [Lysobacteraceae bacterium]
MARGRRSARRAAERVRESRRVHLRARRAGLQLAPGARPSPARPRRARHEPGVRAGHRGAEPLGSRLGQPEPARLVLAAMGVPAAPVGIPHRCRAAGRPPGAPSCEPPRHPAARRARPGTPRPVTGGVRHRRTGPCRWPFGNLPPLHDRPQRTGGYLSTPEAPKEAMRVSDAATLQLAMRGARLGSWTRDLVTQEIRWTPELEMLFGLTPGTLRGSREEFFGFVHPDDRDRLRQSVDEAIDNRRDYECEFRIQHTSGDWRWMIGRGRAEYHADGTPLRLHGIALDVTDTRRAELARDRLAAIVESATAAIISKQLDGTR